MCTFKVEISLSRISLFSINFAHTKKHTITFYWDLRQLKRQRAQWLGQESQMAVSFFGSERAKFLLYFLRSHNGIQLGLWTKSNIQGQRWMQIKITYECLSVVLLLNFIVFFKRWNHLPTSYSWYLSVVLLYVLYRHDQRFRLTNFNLYDEESITAFRLTKRIYLYETEFRRRNKNFDQNFID